MRYYKSKTRRAFLKAKANPDPEIFVPATKEEYEASIAMAAAKQAEWKASHKR